MNKPKILSPGLFIATVPTRAISYSTYIKPLNLAEASQQTKTNYAKINIYQGSQNNALSFHVNHEGCNSKKNILENENPTWGPLRCVNKVGESMPWWLVRG